MKSERVSFLNERGVRLAGRLDLPHRSTPKAYALFAHCFTCNKEFKAAVNIGRSLARAGIAMLRFDFTGLGESEGDFSETNLSHNIEDIMAAVRFLELNDQAPQLLIGHSFGGIALLKAAHAIKSSIAVVTIATPFDPKHVVAHFGEGRAQIDSEGAAEVQVLGHRVLIKKQFIDNILTADIQAELRELDKALLIFHAPGDEVVGIDHAAQIFQHARHPKSFVTLDTADHLLSNRQDATYASELILAWVSRYLEPVPQRDGLAGGSEAKNTLRSIDAAYANEYSQW